MAFKEVLSLETDTTVTIGGVDKKTGKPNPVKIEGYYVGTKGGIPNKYNPSKPNCIHVLQTQKGLVGVWGKTNLDRKMEGQTPGQMMRITFTGTKPSNKGNDMLCYKLEVDPSNTIDVDLSTEAPAQDVSDDSDYSNSAAQDYGTSDDDQDSETHPDEIQAPPARAPKRPAAPVDAARQAKVQALLNSSRSK